MKNARIISIPKPCHENWNEMNPVDKGKFCGSCQKKVHDFTLASDREILEVIRKSPDSCGRFLTTQLDRELVAPEKKSTIWQFVAASFVTTFVAGKQPVMAQEKPTLVQTDSRSPDNTDIVGKTMLQSKIVSGVVSDYSGPLPSADVVIKSTNQGVKTDIDGNFKISVMENDTLVFRYVGLENQEVSIGTSNEYSVTLFPGELLGMGEIVVTGHPSYSSEPNSVQRFFIRIGRRIGNLFR